MTAAYLAGLPRDQADALARVNTPGLEAFRRYLDSGTAVAFLGAGASAPLYPLWTPLIGELIDVAVKYGLPAQAASTCRSQAAARPDAVVEVLRQQLTVPRFREVLRETLRPRRDAATGRSWTPVQELICRCAFRAVVTTNYDPGIVDARVRVRPGASGTGFTSWTDELGLDRWLSGDVFGDDELPVLFAHGDHSRPDEIVLATTEYRRAYNGKLGPVLGRLITADHLIWIGFSFADARIAAVQRQIQAQSGTRTDPGGVPRQVAVLPWDPNPEDGVASDPQTLRTLAEIEYGAELVLYPAPGNDHSALALLLAAFADPRYPAVPLPGSTQPALMPAPAISTPIAAVDLPSVHRSLAGARVLLIGSSSYPKDPGRLPELPGVRGNLAALRELFADPTIVGVRPENLSVVTDPSDTDAVMDVLAELARQPADLLFVYFSGHGLLREGGLRLGLARSTAAGAEHNGLSARLLRAEVANSVARRRILMVDSCFSGQLAGLLADPESVIRGQLQTAGTVTITSSAHDVPSLAPPGEELTAFTGELVDLLRAGLPGEGPVLMVDRVFAELRTRMLGKGRPEPRMLTADLAASGALALNRAHTRSSVLTDLSTDPTR